MIPALQFDFWQWLALTLAAPVVIWGAWPFHRATWSNLRHGAATMDTLVSLGVLAAFGWSLYALFLGGAGEPGMTMPFTLVPARGSGADEIYLEVASGVTLFLLTGRYLEARAKRRSGAALRALLEMGAKDVALLRDGVEARVPVDQLAVGDEFVVRPGEKLADRRRGRSRHLRGRRVDAHRRAGAGRGRAGRRRRRGDGERRRPARGPGDPGRVGHPAGADGPAGRGRPRTARRRCSGSPTGSPRCSCRWCSCSRWRRWASGSARAPTREVAFTAAVAVLDHRLPVRARPGHADGAAGRHRPRRPARHPRSRDPRCWSPPGWSTRSCWTRPARSRPARWRWSTS